MIHYGHIDKRIPKIRNDCVPPLIWKGLCYMALGGSNNGGGGGGGGGNMENMKWGNLSPKK
eukprot:7602124-Ditylum_brightwellii.AAC.1